MKFEAKVPDFYQNDAINSFFVPDLNTLLEFKTSEVFDAEGLEGFMKVSEELEDALLDFVNVERVKVEQLKNWKKEHTDNNEKLRDLNEQIMVAKIERRSFGKNLEDEYDGVILKDEQIK
ncbi:hypothetical protein K5G30_002374 [Enterococcus faecalis]|nr:hypothetical protein [Enterococcus faecalis]